MEFHERTATEGGREYFNHEVVSVASRFDELIRAGKHPDGIDQLTLHRIRVVLFVAALSAFGKTAPKDQRCLGKQSTIGKRVLSHDESEVARRVYLVRSAEVTVLIPQRDTHLTEIIGHE